MRRLKAQQAELDRCPPPEVFLAAYFKYEAPTRLTAPEPHQPPEAETLPEFEP